MQRANPSAMTPYVPNTVFDQVVEAVIGIMNTACAPFAQVTRGALPIGPAITCELGPSTPDTVYMDKNTYVPLDLTLNGKHPNLQTVTNAMNAIHSKLTRATFYPSGPGWEIVDITNGVYPRIIGREENNMWLLASSLYVKIYQKGDD